MLTLWSETLRATIERHVVGQPRAVNAVVRALVRGAAGLADRERPGGVFLFLGPTGSGKSHLPRVLSRLLHRTANSGFADLDCTQVAAGHGLAALAQVASSLARDPHLRPVPQSVIPTVENAILVVDRPEEAPSDLATAIAAALDRGQVSLESGGAVSLERALIFLTSGLCAREIFELSGAHIGFQSPGGNENDEIDQKIFDLCKRASEAFWGPSFLGRMDAVVVFHRLRSDHFPPIIDRQVAALTELLSLRGVVLVVDESARRFLIEKGIKGVRFGARELARALRRFLEYPLGDRLVSGHLAPGQRVAVRAADGELRFDISPERVTPFSPPIRAARESAGSGGYPPPAVPFAAPAAWVPAPAAWMPAPAAWMPAPAASSMGPLNVRPFAWPWPQLPADAWWPGAPRVPRRGG